MGRYEDDRPPVFGVVARESGGCATSCGSSGLGDLLRGRRDDGAAVERERSSRTGSLGYMPLEDELHIRARERHARVGGGAARVGAG